MNYLETFSVDGVSFGVRLMDNNNENEINTFFKLFNECFGQRPHLDKSWYNWYYCNNPNGVCNNYLLFDVDKDTLIGAYGFAKVECAIQAKKEIGVLGVNGMISKDYGKKGLFAKLMSIGLKYETANNLGFSFPNGFNQASIKGHFNCGWTLFEDLHFYEHSSTVLPIIGNVVKELFESDLMKIKTELFNQDSKFYFNRSVEFLKWRFFDRPHKDYVIIGNFVSDEEINGYMIIGTYVNKNQEIISQIVDYRVGNNAVLEMLINEAIIRKINLINLIISDLSNDLSIFEKMGFNRVDECYKLLIYPNITGSLLSGGLLGDFDAV